MDDVEKPARVPKPPGTQEYPMLPKLFGEYPETAVYRRFGSLNALNLLYMQSDLVALEEELHRLQAKDNASDDKYRQLYAHD